MTNFVNAFCYKYDIIALDDPPNVHGGIRFSMILNMDSDFLPHICNVHLDETN